MLHTILVGALLSAVLVAGCHHVPAEQSEADIIKALNKTVRDVIPAHLEQRYRYQAMEAGPSCGWLKRYTESKGDYSIDIRKTDSIVSPYVGVVEFHVRHNFTSCHKTQEEAEKDDIFKGDDSELHRYTFAFQGEAWVPKIQEVHYAGEWSGCIEYGGGCI